MFRGILKPKFYSKCKSAIKFTKVRLETILKKRNAVQKYLKNDVADLLKSGLHYNAYGRVEGLLVEQNRTACYEFVDQYCDCILKNLSVMQKERECPEECREAVSSLIHAAARFADLPELRDLRGLFSEKYGNFLESFLNKEFAQKLRAEPPTKEVKLHLMHNIAEELSLEWDPKALEQKLFKPPPPKQDGPRHNHSNDSDDHGYSWHKSKNDDFQKKDNRDDENKLSKNKEYTKPGRNRSNLNSLRSNKGAGTKYKVYSCSEDEVTEISSSVSTDKDLSHTSPSSVGSASEDDEKRKPFDYRSIPAPYVRPKFAKEASSTQESKKLSGSVAEDKSSSKQDDSVVDANPKPRSVRRRPSRLFDHESLSSVESADATRVNANAVTLEARGRLPPKRTEDEEEKMIDGLLMHYSNKKSPYESSSSRKANSKISTQQGADETKEATRSRNAKSDHLGPRATKVASFPMESTTSNEAKKGHARASSLQPDMLGSHVHPKLPDYDDLAVQLAALRGR
ncbi:hypothetical protein SLE2022_382840 [Rubroshorea leprosula]